MGRVSRSIELDRLERRGGVRRECGAPIDKWGGKEEEQANGHEQRTETRNRFAKPISAATDARNANGSFLNRQTCPRVADALARAFIKADAGQIRSVPRRRSIKGDQTSIEAGCWRSIGAVRRSNRARMRFSQWIPSSDWRRRPASCHRTQAGARGSRRGDRAAASAHNPDAASGGYPTWRAQAASSCAPPCRGWGVDRSPPGPSSRHRHSEWVSEPVAPSRRRPQAPQQRPHRPARRCSRCWCAR